MGPSACYLAGSSGLCPQRRRRARGRATNNPAPVKWPIIISFLPSITSTSTRMHGEFLRLLFLQAHRETTAHFTALRMPAQQHCDSFRFRRAAFYNDLKSKVGLVAAKTAVRWPVHIPPCAQLFHRSCSNKQQVKVSHVYAITSLGVVNK